MVGHLCWKGDQDPQSPVSFSNMPVTQNGYQGLHHGIPPMGWSMGHQHDHLLSSPTVSFYNILKGSWQVIQAIAMGGQPAIEDRQPWVRATQFPHQWLDGLNPHVVDHLSGLCPLLLKGQQINP